MNEVGRGPKWPLKYTIIEDPSQKQNITIHQRDLVKKAIIKQNIKHHKAVFNTKAFKDKTYQKLSNDKIRDQILNNIRYKCAIDSNIITSILF